MQMSAPRPSLSRGDYGRRVLGRRGGVSAPFERRRPAAGDRVDHDDPARHSPRELSDEAANDSLTVDDSDVSEADRNVEMAIERDLEQVHEHRPLGREPFGDRGDQPAVASDGEQVLVGMADEEFSGPA